MKKTKYEIIGDKCPGAVKNSEIKENDIIWQRRRLQRFVNYQINQLKGEKSLDEVLILYNDVMLRSDNPDIYHLIRLSEDGIFERHQFKDAKPNLTQLGYNRWYNDAIKNTFCHTIRTGEIFSASNYDMRYYNGKLNSILDSHSSEELNYQSFSGYSIYQILKSLDYINPFLLFNLIFEDVTIEKINGIDFVTGFFENENGEKRKFAANFGEKDLYILNQNGNIKKIMNMYEFMFKYYKKPIFEVINSVNNAIDYYLCPGEGLYSYSYDKDISEKVSEITSSNVYKKVKRDYVKPFSR